MRAGYQMLVYTAAHDQEGALYGPGSDWFPCLTYHPRPRMISKVQSLQMSDMQSSCVKQSPSISASSVLRSAACASGIWIWRRTLCNNVPKCNAIPERAGSLSVGKVIIRLEYSLTKSYQLSTPIRTSGYNSSLMGCRSGNSPVRRSSTFDGLKSYRVLDNISRPCRDLRSRGFEQISVFAERPSLDY